MEGLKVGDKVRFRSGSMVPEECVLPPDAIGTVLARYNSIPDGDRVWLDVDLGPGLGVLRSVAAEEFEVVAA